MAKKFVRGITGIKKIDKQDLDTNNVNDLLSDGEHNYIHRKKKDKTEEYHNLTNNLKTIQSDNSDLLTVTNHNNTKNSATLHPHHDAQKEQVLECTNNTITISHGENGTDEKTTVATNPSKVLEHDNLKAGYGITKTKNGNNLTVALEKSTVDGIVDEKISDLKVDEKITALSNSVDAKISNLNVDGKITNLSNSVDAKINNLNIDEKINSLDIDGKLTTLSNSVDAKISNLNVDGKITNLSNSVDAKINNLNIDEKINSLDIDGKLTTLSNSVDAKINNLNIDGKIDAKVANKQDKLVSNNSIVVNNDNTLGVKVYTSDYDREEGFLRTYTKTVQQGSNFRNEFTFNYCIRAGQEFCEFTLNNHDLPLFQTILHRYGTQSMGSYVAYFNNTLILLTENVSKPYIRIGRHGENTERNLVISFTDII